MFDLFQSHCQVCGNLFKRNKYKWVIRGKRAWVCQACNSKLERRVSSAAFGKEVDWPEVRPPSGCGKMFGFLGTGAVGLLVLSFINNAMFDKNRAPSAPAVSTISEPLPSKAPAPKVPLFRDPLRATESVLNMGLTDTAPGKQAWRKTDPGWYGLAKMVTHKGGLSKVGDVDNDITCMHSSDYVDHVKSVRWTANVFNEAGAAATLPKYKELCMKYAQSLGCPIPLELFQNVNPTNGQKLETEEAVFEIKRLAYKLGYGWEFMITSN